MTVTTTKTTSNNMVFDVEKVRQDFPILRQQVNAKELVYLDNAATSQKPQAVIDALVDYYSHYNANIHRGVHSLSEKATDAYEQARVKIQKFIHAKHASEIVFVRGTTEAINLVAQSYGTSHIKADDEIIISEMEHHSNIVPWQILCQQTGAKLKVIPMNDQGELLIEQYQQLFTKKTKLVAIVHISNALGTINPIQSMIDIAHQHHVPVLIDGAQAAPHTAIDVQALDCDFYTISGHKMYGPTGIGALYAKQALLETMPPYQGGGEMIKMVQFDHTIYNDVPFKFEAGTMNIAAAIAFGHAIDYISALGIERIAHYEQQLLEHAQQAAANYPGLRLIGTAANKASIFSFLLDNIHPHDIGTILDSEGIAVRTGHHCAMPAMQHFKINGTARASFCLYNTKSEIDKLFQALHKVQEVFGS